MRKARVQEHRVTSSSSSIPILKVRAEIFSSQSSNCLKRFCREYWFAKKFVAACKTVSLQLNFLCSVPRELDHNNWFTWRTLVDVRNDQTRRIFARLVYLLNCIRRLTPKSRHLILPEIKLVLINSKVSLMTIWF